MKKENNMESIRNISMDQVEQLNPLQLAFIGDAVYETYVRVRVLSFHSNFVTSRLHQLCVKYVKASAQSEIMNILESELTETEMRVYKRGRNAKSNTVPKNAKVSDYRRATGFEALIGYLHLVGEHERVDYILKRSVEIIEKENKNG